ncbi:heavy metal translocating P-type ATPase [Lacrimispora sphenoides]|uniref:Cd(2+)-exporting ATPase n=1 Tax=Lacrimispora sphenoides JCM 1415 TaxID=1297793 RepID=A0ABY1CAG7_9FIRM|nr:cation-translocating P-type ATPase [Lacrimispora sphenoides]SET84662.1 copper-(or silver)-translocating P-type ATPase [[Clostridium] sphenoides JCM 1415]SUY51724.1 heavy metal translocating P-type ATPase [Lacrimispora sphenoides]
MLKKISDLFAGLTMTIISGAFLVLSLILLLTGKEVPLNPAWITILLSGYPLIYLAVTRLVYEKWISSALLISIAMAASVAIGEFFAAGEVAFIMAIGAILEEKTVERSKRGLKQLISLTPMMGRRILTDASGSREEMIPLEQIQQGDILRILPGETIPVDGEITEGNTSIDQSVITGESLPVDKSVGDQVFCGTINRYGSIEVVTARANEDSSLQKLIRMVQEAENKKAPIQRIADQWAAWLVPVALGISVASLGITWALGYEIMEALNRAVTVLVVFCPCALALATPTSIMAAIGQATKHGVIIKSGEALENMGKVDCIAFDKTGTLTRGIPVVADVVPLKEEVGEEQLLRLTASAEAYSEHPLAKAIVSHAKELQMTIEPAENFQMLPGKGISATVNGQTLLCGTVSFLKEKQILVDESVSIKLEKYRAQGKAMILVARERSLIGAITLSDTLRDTAYGVVKELHGMNTRVVLLTGDHIQAAGYFAEKIGIGTVKAGLLPEDKVSSISGLKKQGKKVCMIGDGVNDAPALKIADVGVAMGSMGSDIAIEAADIALTGDDISMIPYLKRLSNSTVHTIKFNITISMAINVTAILLSVTGVLNPVSGALVHNAGSVLVVLNAALLYDRKFT